MMAGLLLARAGVSTVLLEKHADFLRDFRGDTIHPSTLDVMGELGLLESFLQRPHTEVTTLSGNLGDRLVKVADFTRLPTRCKSSDRSPPPRTPKRKLPNARPLRSDAPPHAPLTPPLLLQRR